MRMSVACIWYACEQEASCIVDVVQAYFALANEHLKLICLCTHVLGGFLHLRIAGTKANDVVLRCDLQITP
jgi:hypothetical protein